MADRMTDMVEAVKRHADDNYESDGWDYVVECYSDAEIAEVIEHAGAQDCAEAIDVLHCEVKTRDDYRKEIQATAW